MSGLELIGWVLTIVASVIGALGIGLLVVVWAVGRSKKDDPQIRRSEVLDSVISPLERAKIAQREAEQRTGVKK